MELAAVESCVGLVASDIADDLAAADEESEAKKNEKIKFHANIIINICGVTGYLISAFFEGM